MRIAKAFKLLIIATAAALASQSGEASLQRDHDNALIDTIQTPKERLSENFRLACREGDFDGAVDQYREAKATFDTADLWQCDQNQHGPLYHAGLSRNYPLLRWLIAQNPATFFVEFKSLRNTFPLSEDDEIVKNIFYKIIIDHNSGDHRIPEIIDFINGDKRKAGIFYQPYVGQQQYEVGLAATM